MWSKSHFPSRSTVAPLTDHVFPTSIDLAWLIGTGATKKVSAKPSGSEGEIRIFLRNEKNNFQKRCDRFNHIQSTVPDTIIRSRRNSRKKMSFLTTLYMKKKGVSVLLKLLHFKEQCSPSQSNNTHQWVQHVELNIFWCDSIFVFHSLFTRYAALTLWLWLERKAPLGIVFPQQR